MCGTRLRQEKVCREVVTIGLYNAVCVKKRCGSLLSKVLIIGVFLAILYTLASSFYFMIKDDGDGERTVRRLSWRVGLSIGLVAALWLGFQFGIIEPQGVNPVRYPAPP